VESLVIAATIIVSPAMYGGPLALVLSFWKSQRIGLKRRLLIYFLSTTAIISGTFLVIQNISRGATIIGISGLVTAICAIERIRRLK
jgi:hypothetical protein